MGSITLRGSFEAQHQKLEPPVEYSLDREPWRAFRSSSAIKFTSRRRGGWSATQLTAQTKADIISGLEARVMIISSYSRSQAAIRDLVAKAGFTVQSSGQIGAYSAADKEVLTYAKRLTREGGPFFASHHMWDSLLNRVRAGWESADLIVHGFAEVREEKTGAIVFRFRLWGGRRSFTSDELCAKAAELELLARDAEARLVSAIALL